jgi:hypothetical protein
MIVAELVSNWIDFSKAIRLQPKNADFHHNRAFCLRQMDRLEVDLDSSWVSSWW